MKKRICVETSIKAQLQKFLDAEGIKIEVATDQNYDVAVVKCDDRKESNLDKIYSGGWIVCETARALAKKLEISISQMGQLLDELDVKIRSCSLGCFK